jgi:hypothetical protein
MESEGHFPTEHGASRAQEVEGIVGIYVRRGARGSGADGANQGGGGKVGNREENALNHAAETTYWAEDGVQGSALGPGVHAEAVLLVSPGDGHKSSVK